MARKYDRYGRNRQFRRNPTRSRKFFPYQLPYQPDFRFLTRNGTEVSAATAARWRQVVADITNPNKRKRDDDDDGLYQRMQHLTQSPPLRQIGRDLRYVAEAMITAEMPLASIPLSGLEMLINPEKVSKRFGGGVIATTVGLGILGAKKFDLTS